MTRHMAPLTFTDEQQYFWKDGKQTAAVLTLSSYYVLLQTPKASCLV